MENSLKKVFIELKEKTLDLPCTPFRSKIVEQIDYALDCEKDGADFITILREISC